MRWKVFSRTGAERLITTLLAGAVIFSGVSAQAIPIDASGASQCKARGFSIDPDPNGTNIRSAPRANAPVIGHLSARVRLAPDTYTRPEFEIVGSKDGWLAIRNAKPKTDLKLEAANEADGRSWISGRLVGVTLASEPLRAAPRRDACHRRPPVGREFQSAHEMRPLRLERLIGAALAAGVLIGTATAEEPRHLEDEAPLSLANAKSRCAPTLVKAGEACETPLWREQDGPTCAQGGRAHVDLQWRGDRIAVGSVRIDKAGKCGEPLPH